MKDIIKKIGNFFETLFNKDINIKVETKKKNDIRKNKNCKISVHEGNINKSK